MKKKTFWQIFLLTAVCISILFVYGIIAVNANSKNIIKKRLAEETKLACSLLNSTDDFENLSSYRGDNGFRITVIDLEGNVLFDSNTQSPLESHIDREEIRAAINGKPRAVERYSETLGYEMTYYALKTQINDPSSAEPKTIILRLAVKSSEIYNYMGITIPVLIVVLVISLIFSFIFSSVISEKVTNKINEVGKSLRSLNNGNYVPMSTNSTEPELYSVLNEINDLNSSTHKLIQTETEERAKLNTVLENISQGIIAIDKNNCVIFTNRSALDIFGCPSEESGKDIVFLIDDYTLCGMIAQRLNENCAFEYNYRGAELSVAIKKADDLTEQGDVRSIIIITDVTKEKEIAKQKSDFFANASHELKTPVAVMQGLSELLLAKDLDEGSKKQVDRIHKESLRLSSLISDMLKLSRLESGDVFDEVTTEVDLNVTTKEVLTELSSKIDEKHLTATVTGNGTILGDGKKIYELIENLLSNAVNYNKENGEITVNIADLQNTVVLKVTDTGIGIEKENIPRLCERFYRVDKSRSKKTGGTGLGLAIVKHICALYNASLSIESDLGLGTTVTVTFKK